MATSNNPPKRRRRTPAASTTRSIRLERSLDERLKVAANAAGRPVSQLMRDAAEAYVVNLVTPKASVIHRPAEPAQAPPWAVHMAHRLEAIEMAGKQHVTYHLDALSRIDRSVELLTAKLHSLADTLGKTFGVKLTQPPEPSLDPESKPKPKLKPVYKELSVERQEQLIALGSMTSMPTREVLK